MSKISVVVPAYNCADTIIQCVGSILNQSLQDVDIVIVNDASTDNTLDILYELERAFPERICIVNSDVNMGVGGARNTGLEYISGDYVGFVDSDDYIHSTMYEKLYDKAVSTGYDVIDTGYFCKNKDVAILHTKDEWTGVLDGNKRSELIAAGGYVWNKIYKRSLFHDKNLRFRTNCILEDAEFITYLFASIETIGNVKDVLYFYNDSSDSLSKPKEAKKLYTNLYNAIEATYKKLYSLPTYGQIRDAVEFGMLQMYGMAIVSCIKDFRGEKKLDTYHYLSKLRELKKSCVSGGYGSKHVKSQLDCEDIRLMKLVDKSVSQAIEAYS